MAHAHCTEVVIVPRAPHNQRTKPESQSDVEAQHKKTPHRGVTFRSSTLGVTMHFLKVVLYGLTTANVSLCLSQATAHEDLSTCHIFTCTALLGSLVLNREVVSHSVEHPSAAGAMSRCSPGPKAPCAHASSSAQTDYARTWGAGWQRVRSTLRAWSNSPGNMRHGRRRVRESQFG